MATEKVTMNITSDNLDFVRELSAKTGMNNTSVVNHAILLEKYVRDAAARGAKILVEEPNGTTREVIIR